MKFWKYKKSLFLLLVAAAGMTGCVQEYGGEEIITPPSGNEVTITVNIPGQQIPTTRSIAGAAGEATVAFIDLLVFDSDGKLSEHVAGTDIAPVEGGENYKVTFKAALSDDDDAETVMIVANMPAATISAAAVEGDTKATVLAALTHSSTGKWNTNAGSYTPIPMYGEVAIGDIGSQSISLTRMLARVDVVNSASGFTLSEVYVVNYNTKGNLQPKWDGDEKPVLNLPALPAPLTGYSNALKYDYSGTGLLGDIYTYEAAATSGNEGNASHYDAICLIVKGKYLGTDYYYRIDFTVGEDATGKVPGAAGFNSATVGYMPVYRNHLYTFTIGEVNGVGFPATPAGFDDALKSFGVLNNLKTNLHVVDQSGIKNMVFNGQHFIGMGDAVTFDYEEGLEATVPCVTNYWGGWSLDTNLDATGITYETGTEKWLKADKIDANTIRLTTDKNNKIPADRVAYVHVKAGRLTHKLKVTQIEGLLYVGRFGGELKPNADGEWAFTKELWMQKADESTTAIKWAENLGDTGATHIEDGRGNTFKLHGLSATNYPAANLCYNKNTGTISGESDLIWYLPAQNQLMAVWVSYVSYPAAYRPSDDSYWSATDSEYEDYLSAWGVHFIPGHMTYSFKTLNCRVRCVREF